jgi:RimJ/RimL family protein N-acetyltransferase
MRVKGTLIELRPWKHGEEAALVRHLNSRSVWRNLTDRVPHPYTLSDAETWIQHVKMPGRDAVHLAIAIGDDPIGTVGFERLSPKLECRFTAEIGYWLGEGFWGRGIATEALRLATELAFSEHDFARLQAIVFEWNPASCRVLEKNGYGREASLRRSVFKDQQLIDSWIYARLRPS